MQFLRNLAILFYLILTLIGIVLVILSIIGTINSPLSYFLAVIISVIGLFILKFQFQMMQQRGVLETLSGTNSAYDGDLLVPLENESLKKVKTFELLTLFHAKRIPCKGIWEIYGCRKIDYFNLNSSIKNILWSEELQKLTFHLTDGQDISIFKPKNIYINTSYLKISYANQVRLLSINQSINYLSQ